MKKIWLIILSSILTISSVILLWSTVLAEDSSNAWDDTIKVKGVDWVTGDSKIGINFWDNCLTGMWKWCFDYDKIIWIDKSQNNNITVTSIAQDVILAATYMVWTVLTIIIIWCWLWYIFASRDGKDVNKYKQWLIRAAIWALLVRWAYAIVRLIQYIAKW